MSSSEDFTQFRIEGVDGKIDNLLRRAIIVLYFMIAVVLIAVTINQGLQRGLGDDVFQSNLVSGLLIALPLVFLVIPHIYYLGRGFSHLYSALSFKKNRSISALFGLIPFFSGFDGTWFIEKNSEVRKFGSITEILRFFFSNLNKFVIYPLAGLVLSIQLNLNYLNWLNPDYEGGIPINAIFSSGGGVVDKGSIASFQFMMISLFLFVLVNQILWLLEDSELKIMKAKQSSLGNTTEIDELYPAVAPLTALLDVFLGFGAVFWFADQLSNNFDAEPTSIFRDISRSEVITNVLFIYLSFILLLWIMALFYMYSGMHEKLVNQFRQSMTKKRNISIKTIRIEDNWS